MPSAVGVARGCNGKRAWENPMTGACEKPPWGSPKYEDSTVNRKILLKNKTKYNLNKKIILYLGYKKAPIFNGDNFNLSRINYLFSFSTLKFSSISFK